MHLDIPFPNTEYQIMNKIKSFNLIYPVDHPLSQSVKIDMIIRILSFTDPDYSAFVEDKKPQEYKPIARKLFEISYIRECKLNKVTRSEWQNNYGPDSPREFMQLSQDLSWGSYVKIVNLAPLTHSLSDFNRTFKNER